jgi:hypothetical protein
MIPNATTTDHTQPTATDDGSPRFFLEAALDTDSDGDWWLDLGLVDLPGLLAV